MLLYECKKEQNHKIKRKESKKMAILAVIGLWIIGLGLGFLVNAGLVWVITWGLVKIGITTIFGWTVAFSWPLVIVFMAVFIILKAIFGITVKKES